MRRVFVRFPPILAASAAVMVVLAQCSSSGGAQPAAANTPTTPTTVLVVTYGVDPTESAKMVCGADGQAALKAALNVTAQQVTTPTWVDHRYSCTYQYDTGSLTLSVKELPTIVETINYFNSLKAQSTVTQAVPLGQDGFITTDNTSVVRKDNKVLDVDVTKLPSQFGNPLRSPADASLNIAVALLGCWTGD